MKKQKNWEKPWFQRFEWLLIFEYYFFVNIPIASNKAKNFWKSLLFAKLLKKRAGSGSVRKCTDPRIRIRLKMSRIRNIWKYTVYWNLHGNALGKIPLYILQVGVCCAARHMLQPYLKLFIQSSMRTNYLLRDNPESVFFSYFTHYFDEHSVHSIQSRVFFIR